MDRLKVKISQYSRWTAIKDYISRIETYLETDFSLSLENAKALLECIGKEICSAKGHPLAEDSSVNGVLKNAFNALGYSKNEIVPQISSSLATIGQKLGGLRNDIGATAHGKTLEQLNSRNDNINQVTKYFLIDSVELIACFLIGLFEGEHISNNTSSEIKYTDCEDFNDYWDDLYGEFYMGDYSFTASEVLFNNDINAYRDVYYAYLIDIAENDEQ